MHKVFDWHNDSLRNKIFHAKIFQVILNIHHVIAVLIWIWSWQNSKFKKITNQVQISTWGVLSLIIMYWSLRNNDQVYTIYDKPSTIIVIEQFQTRSYALDHWTEFTPEMLNFWIYSVEKWHFFILNFDFYFERTNKTETFWTSELNKKFLFFRISLSF